MMQVWTVAMGQIVFTEFGSLLGPSQTTKNTSAARRFFMNAPAQSPALRKGLP
jgi:hypothetical protein